MGILSKKTGGDTIPGMDPQKTNILAVGGVVGVLLVLIVAGVAFFTFYSTSPQGGGPNIPNTTSNQSVEPPCDEACQFEKIKLGGDLASCDQLNQTRNDCLLYFGYMDIATCTKISEQSVLKACVMHHALAENSIELCDNLAGDDKNVCIAAVDECYFKTGDARALCYAVNKKDYNYCAQNVGCIYDYAKETHDGSACEVLGEPIKNLTCVSLATGQDFCRNAANPSQMDYCYASLAQETENRYYCDNIQEKASIAAEECYSFFAVKEQDPEFCEEVDILDNQRWICLTDYALKTGELEGCDAIDEYARVSKTNCYLKLAKEINDPRICEYLEITPKYQCYVANINIRTDLLTKEKCDGVRSESWRNRCYLEAGKNMNDSTICNAITTESEREFCIGVVEQKINEEEES